MGKIVSKVKVVNKDDITIDPVSREDLQDLQGFVIPQHDYIGVTYPTTSSEVFTYKTGGSGGATVGVITVVYTDATKEVLVSVTQT